MPEADFGIDSVKVHGAQRLVMGDLTRDMGLHLGLGQGAAGAAHDEGHRHLARLVIGPADHGAIGDLGMADQQRLKFRRRDLEALDLDEFLHPVDDAEEALLVDQRQIAGVQPALGVKRAGRRLGVVEVSHHHLRARAPKVRPRPRVRHRGLCRDRRSAPRCWERVRPTRRAACRLSRDMWVTGLISVMP